MASMVSESERKAETKLARERHGHRAAIRPLEFGEGGATLHFLDFPQPFRRLSLTFLRLFTVLQATEAQSTIS